MKTGYSVVLARGQVPDNLRCSSCNLVLRKPLQNICGHRFCAECLSTAVRTSVSPSCPVDNIPILKEESFHDMFAEREVLALVVKCPSRKGNNGCDWTGELRTLKDHEDTCDFTPRPCPSGCDQFVSKHDLNAHLRNDCPARLASCEYCRREMKLNQMARHTESCTEAPTSCPNSCSSEIYPRSQLAEHLQVCPKQTVKCFYSTTGCDFEGHRCDLPAHHEASLAYHLQICYKQAKSNQEAIGSLMKQNSLLAEKCASLEHSFVSLQVTVEETINNITDRKVPSKIGERSARNLTNKELDSLKDTSSNQDKRLASIERSVAFHDVQLSELDIRQNLQDSKMSNGVLVWKISNFRKHRQDAISGKTLSLYSPPFYTSPAGYKVCGRIYPNGDGVGRGTHLSFFVVIMRGEFDAILSWPFSQKISLVLLDQCRVNPRDIVETFRPDASSSSYQRPTKEMNVASGCPLFVHLSALSDSSYTREDTIYLKVIIHSHGLKPPDEV